MTLVKTIKKLKKLGYAVNDNGRQFWIESNGRVMSFIVNGRREDDAEVHCINVRRENDHSDSMTDYSAGAFYPNLTQGLRALAYTY